MQTTRANYREWLREELASRCSRNPLYSLRAFARALDLRPSHLSEILRGNLGLSADSAGKVATHLDLSDSERTLFVTLVEASHSRNRARRETAKAKLATLDQAAGYRTLDDEVFEVISDWQHYAILELAQTDKFVPRYTWIAEKLGLKRVEVEAAVRRLKAVGLLTTKDGKWTVSNKFPATKSGIPSAAIRKFHGQILGKATDALHLVPVARRDFSTMTFPVNPADLPSIGDEIREFRRALEKKYKARSGKTEVYALSVQFFPLTEVSNA